MKALEKDRDRRYDTAKNLAADVERYLHNETVEAVPASATYRFRKFVRRHKIGVAASAAMAAALLLGRCRDNGRYDLGIARTESRTSRAAYAKSEAVRSEQVAKFLKDMLAAARTKVARGRDTTLLREILDNTAERVGKDLPEQPEVRGDLWSTLGTTYASIGDSPRT